VREREGNKRDASSDNALGGQRRKQVMVSAKRFNEV